MGWWLGAKSAYEEAISALTALLENKQVEPKMQAVAYRWRANWYRLSKQYGLALPDLEKAVGIDADDSEYWQDLGNVYYDLSLFHHLER